MRAADEAALICDFAQYYHIADYKSLDVEYAAVLACGLPADSRTVRKLSGQKLSVTDTLLAMAVDKLAFLVWSKTKDGYKNRNRPESVLLKLTGKEKKETSEHMVFASVEEFEKQMAKY